MKCVRIETIQKELKRQYEEHGKLQTFVFAMEHLQRDPSILFPEYETLFPEKAGDMSDREFYHCFQKAMIPLDSFRASMKEKNWRDHPSFGGKKAYINVQKHINYADQQYHQHIYYEITYIMKGTCTMRFDKKTLKLRTGDMCIIFPSARHEILITDDDTFAVNMIVSPYSFQNMMRQIVQGEDLISNYLKEILYHVEIPNFLFIHTSGSEEIKKYIKEAACHTHHPNLYSLGMAYNWISLLLATALQEFRSSIFLYQNSNPSIQNHHLDILEYINEHYKTVTLDQLADRFGYNRSYLSRLITQLSGKTFTEIITERKLEDACEYLEQTDLTVKEIAELCGFEDQNYFSKVFRKQYQVSPSNYRNFM